MRALAIASTGMSAQQTNVEVIANNIANINTTAFKRARAEFSDLMYQTERASGVPNAGGQDVVPEGAELGLGTKTVGIRNLHLQGPLAQTGNPLDVAINGKGWFQVSGPNGEALFTRAGSFNKSAEGEIVTGDGYVVDPAIQVPNDTLEIIVNQSGEVYARLASATEPQLLGQFALVNFANDSGLQPLGNNLYRESVASGQPIAGVASDPGFGSIEQGYLEGSNVDPVKEITELITAQRAYEMNSKVIKAADDMASAVTNGIR